LSTNEWTFLSSVGFNQSDSLLGRSLLGLSLKELVRVIALTHWSFLLLPTIFVNSLPQLTQSCRLPPHGKRSVTRLSPCLKYY